MVAGSIPAGVAKFERRAIPILTLLPWDDAGLGLLRAMNTPEQKHHLGGVETEDKLAERQGRYLTYHRPGETEMLRIAADGEIVGSICYWETERDGAPAYETGWEVLPAHHGRGLGVAAARALLDRLRPLARHRYVFAFPTPDNPASNGICRKLGFELLGVEDTEYPTGVWSPHNVWRLDLRPAAI
ncbi:MAG: GNAT family N-acetyltransferase [Devosia sp.]|uniref:GNAT family N-acetyltransferase n=1 Tax=Devosia sp. TaxID=1871048 RepID=UPI001A4E0F5F|nr:GNAT family protein [Devosia sp.]MBL8596874.1 GNAT family N-acetyltransferase [Devosia sp.]